LFEVLFVAQQGLLDSGFQPLQSCSSSFSFS
jgi:hypothetical protein